MTMNTSRPQRCLNMIDHGHLNSRSCSHSGYCSTLYGGLTEGQMEATIETDSNIVDSQQDSFGNLQARIFLDILGWWDLLEPLLSFAPSSCWSLALSLMSPCERFIVVVTESVSPDESCKSSLVAPGDLWSSAVLKRLCCQARGHDLPP